MNASNKVRVEVLLFGQAREAANSSSVILELDAPATVETAFAELSKSHPRLAEMRRSMMFAVNEEYADLSRTLADGDRVAVLPPVSGGQSPGEDIFEITREPIDISGLRSRLLTPESGALVVFDGVARNSSGGRRTLRLEYEGYDAMALKVMREIGAEARERWPVNRLGIVHRLGRVDIGESSVAIVVASAHRKTAFEACRFVVDRLKQVVPIWKKEYFEDGEVWVENEESRRSPSALVDDGQGR